MLKSGFLWIGPIALVSLSAVAYGRQAGYIAREYDPDALVKIIEKLLAQ